jgi:hypothetical protein
VRHFPKLLYLYQVGLPAAKHSVAAFACAQSGALKNAGLTLPSAPFSQTFVFISGRIAGRQAQLDGVRLHSKRYFEKRLSHPPECAIFPSFHIYIRSDCRPPSTAWRRSPALKAVL